MKQLITAIFLPILLFFARYNEPQTSPQSPSSPPNQSISILFAGDLMLDRHIRRIGETHGYDYIFEKIKPMLTDADLVVANLEGPITTNPSISINSAAGTPPNYIFTFDPVVIHTLVNHNIRLVNLGNNHIYNFGQDGLTQTTTYLNQAGIDYFGHTPLTTNMHTYAIIEVKDQKIAFVNYNQFIPNAITKTLEDIKTARPESDVVIVYCHWGNEYQTQPSTQQQRIAYQLIDAGADAIIGSHPHVIQPSEIYNDRPIYYSLGNFVFDQYFSTDTQRGLLIEITIDQNRQLHSSEHTITIPSSGQINI